MAPTDSRINACIQRASAHTVSVWFAMARSSSGRPAVVTERAGPTTACPSSSASTRSNPFGRKFGPAAVVRSRREVPAAAGAGAGSPSRRTPITR